MQCVCDISGQNVHINHCIIFHYSAAFKHSHSIAALLKHIVVRGYGVGLCQVKRLSADHDITDAVCTLYGNEILFFIQLDT